MTIPREAEHTVTDDLAHFPAVAILGPRQAGKTTLAKSLLSSRPDALYLDLELHSDLSRLQDPETFLTRHRDRLVCIDEVQLRPDLFPLLRALIDSHRKPGRFLILGSSSPDLLRQSSETLAGRLSHVYITPFHLRELQCASAKPKHWSAFLWRGGFPSSYLATDDARSFRWRENYIQSFVERDLRRFGVELNPQHMRRLWRMCAHAHGQVVNYSKLGQALDMTHPTIKRHIDVFEATFMMRRLAPFEVNTKKRLVKSPKLYIRDSGILACLHDLDDFEKLHAHPTYGSCWEGFAIENVLAALKPRGRYGFFRTRTGDEIDLVVERRGRLIGFECRASSHPKLSAGNQAAAKILELDALFVVTPHGDAYPIEGDAVWVTPLDQLEQSMSRALARASRRSR